MNIIRFCVLFFGLMLLAFIVLSCVAMGSVKARRPQGKPVKRPKTLVPKIIVRLGKPYIAELHPIKK